MSVVRRSLQPAPAPGSVNSKVVRFKLDYNLKNLFLDFVSDRDRDLYEEFICHIRDLGQEIRDDDLLQLLKEARGCISILDANFRLFVQVVLILRWVHRSVDIVKEYQGFLQDLCSAHNYYTKGVVDHLVSSFKVGAATAWENSEPSDAEEKGFLNLHQVIQTILRVIPMSQDILVTSVQNNYPYIKKPAIEHQRYIYNIFRILEYEPSLRSKLLSIVISKVVSLDAHTPRSSLETEEAMDVDESEIFKMDVNDKAPSSLGETLDASLVLLFKYSYSVCHDCNGSLLTDAAKSYYLDIFKIFEDVILPTHAIHHVQFIIFYVISFKQGLAISFLDSLWRKASTPNVPPIIRQTAVSYIASLLARANFIPLTVVKRVLMEMASWIHSYINNQDEVRTANVDVRIHGVFYSTCQALFYVIAFRYKELIENKGLLMLQGLNLSKVVTCRLNPLKFCLPVIVQNFANIARVFQLAYCYTIIERNSRSSLPQVYRDSSGATKYVSHVHLDTFFPFDPYLLKKSKKYLEKIYKEYDDQSELENTLVEAPSKNDEEDDFLESPPAHHSTLSTFSYSTSPGFLHV